MAALGLTRLSPANRSLHTHRYTEGAEIYDDTSSGGSDYATDEDDKLLFQDWQRQADHTAKEVFDPDATAAPAASGAILHVYM